MSVNILAVVVAAVAVFLASGGWYAVFGNQLKALRTGVAVSRPPALQAAVELLRNLVVAGVVAGLVARLELGNWTGAALLTVNGVPFVMAATNADERPRAFSLLPAMIALFTFAGSLVAGLLPGALADWLSTTLDDAAPYRAALWLAPLGFALAGLHFAALRPVTVTSKQAGMEPRTAVPMREFVVYTLIIFFAACREGAVRNFFNLYLDRQLHVPSAQIGAVMGFAQLLPVAIALITPLILVRLGTGMTLAAATVFSALCIATMGLVPHWFVAAAMLMAVLGMSAVAGPAQNLFSQEIVSPRWRTTTSALSTVGMASGWATVAAMGGYAIAAVGFSAFFLLCATLSLTSALVVLVYVRRTTAARATAVVAVD